MSNFEDSTFAGSRRREHSSKNAVRRRRRYRHGSFGGRRSARRPSYHNHYARRPAKRTRGGGVGLGVSSALSGFLAMAGLIGLALSSGIFGDDDDDTIVTFNPNITIGGDNITVQVRFRNNCQKE